MAPVARARGSIADDERGSSLSQTSTDTPTNKDTITEVNSDGMSWYIRSWPSKSKATAVTEVAREGISATNLGSPQSSRSSSSLRSVSGLSKAPSIRLTKKGEASTRSLPADVATTRVNIASAGISPMPTIYNNTIRGIHSGLKASNSAKTSAEESAKVDEPHEPGSQQQGSSNTVANNTSEAQPEESQNSRVVSQGWFDWLSVSRLTNDSSSQAGNSTMAKGSPTSTQIPAKSIVCTTESENTKPSTGEGFQQGDNGSPDKENQAPQPRSWLPLWGGASAGSQAESIPKLVQVPRVREDNPATSTSLEPEKNAESTQPNEQPTTRELGTSQSDNKSHERADSISAWLFWPKGQPDVGSTIKKEVEPAESDVTPEGKPKEQPEGAATSQDGPVLNHSRVKTSAASSKSAISTEPSPSSVPQEPPLQPGNVSTPVPTKKTENIPPNQVLPTFESSFPIETKPGLIEQLSRLIYKRGHEPKHVLRVQNPPRINKAIAIGVHGYFPTPLLRTVIGQPTGTSIKFATMAAKAIEEWADENNSPCHIEKIALEGEGRIAERVELLWKLLLNWIEHIREADFILLACHSQGVPVATMLASKLIAFGCVSNARIGICAMAGINLGPFVDYRSRWISGSAGELFDFSSADSKVSQDYRTALREVLKFGVKVTYVGSIDDQLVSMESSTFSIISHPHVNRAIFVDGRVHAPSFLSHLIGFIMKLRNLGVSDHGLIRELSSPLAGSLYTGEGHSRLYDEMNVYKLAIRFALETTQLNNGTLQIHKMFAPTASTTTSNPYILPFAMRGVLEEDYVRQQLSDETNELLKQFEDWKPSTKILKDVKFRLEGVRSKL